ncbi:MAG: hypothetical protein ABIH11_02940 [Candidatus Altiarchaeota archaeon]
MNDFLRGFRKGFEGFGKHATGAVNSILLTIVYVLGVGPVSLAYRISGRHFLDMKKRDGTYYVERKTGEGKREEYYRQF